MFLHTNSELSEKEIRKVIPFTIEPTIIKYLAINLPKKVKDLYTENYKPLLLHFRTNFRCSISLRNTTGFLIWITFNLYIVLGTTDILTILILSIHA